MHPIGRIGRAEADVHCGGLIAIGNEVLHSNQRQRLRHIPIGRGEGQRVRGDDRLIVIGRAEGHRHGSLRWGEQHKGRAVVSGTLRHCWGRRGETEGRTQSAVYSGHGDAGVDVMDHVPCIGGGHRECDHGLLVPIDDVVFGPIERDRLGYIVVATVEGQRGGGDRGLIVISRAQRHSDRSGWR